MLRWALLALSALPSFAQTISTGRQGYAWTIDGVAIIPGQAVREGDNQDRRTWKSASVNWDNSASSNWDGFASNAFVTPWDPTRITVPLAMGRDSIANTDNGGVTFTVTGHSFPFDEDPAGSAYWERRPVFLLRQCAEGADDTAYAPRGRHGAYNDPDGTSNNQPTGQTIFGRNRRPCHCAESETADDDFLVVNSGATPDQGLALQVIPTSSSTGTLTLSPGQVGRILTTAAFGGGANDADQFISANEGMESDWILCGQSEVRKHTHPILTALDLLNDGDAGCIFGAQPCEVPPARGRFVAGIDAGAASGLWATNGAADPLDFMLDADANAFRVANGVVLQFRRSCASDLECIQRAEDGDPASDVDRENYINVWDGRYRRSCQAVPPGPSGQNRGSICVNSERDRFCGQALYDGLSEKCCSSDTQTGAGHVFPAELANKQNGSPGVVERDPWTCPCTAGDGRDALGALEPAIGNTNADGFDLGASVSCGRDGEACCAYTKYSGLANAASVAEVNPNFLAVPDDDAFLFGDFLCPIASDDQTGGAFTFNNDGVVGTSDDRTVNGLELRTGCEPGAITYGIDHTAAFNADFAANILAPYIAYPPAAGSGAALLGLTDPLDPAITDALDPDLFAYGSVAYPFYSCFNTQYQACCDDGTVFDPSTSQCCPITGVQPTENPCPCVNDGDCTAGKTCCSQTSPPPVRENYLDAMCSQFANHHGTGQGLREDYNVNSGSSLGGLLTSEVPLTDRLYYKLLLAIDAGTNNLPDTLQAIDTHFLHPADERVRSKSGSWFTEIGSPGNTDRGVLDSIPSSYAGREGGVCPGKCIDPAWQLCCNGAVCHESYETCCNTTCCNKKSQGCVSGGQLPAEGHGVHTVNGLAPLFSAAASYLKIDDVWSGLETADDDDTVTITRMHLPSFLSALRSQGRSQWFWTANNLGSTYDMCTEIEYLSPVKAFWVFVLPTFLMVFTVFAVFIVATFVNNEAQKGQGEGFKFYDKWALGLAALQAVFVLPTYFSPQWVYGLVVVLASLFGLVAFAARNRYLKTVFVGVHLVVLIYLINPLHGNQWFNLTPTGDNDSSTFAEQGLVPAVLSNWATYDRFNGMDAPSPYFDFGAYYGVNWQNRGIQTRQGNFGVEEQDFKAGPQTNIPNYFVSPWFRIYHNTEPFLNQNVANQPRMTNSGEFEDEVLSQCNDGRGPWETPGDYCLHNLREDRDYYGGYTHVTPTLSSGRNQNWNERQTILQTSFAGTATTGQQPPAGAGAPRNLARPANGLFIANTAGTGLDDNFKNEPVNPWGIQGARPAENPFRSGCSGYYDYFELDARLLDLDRQANHDERFFGYCSRGWTVFLAVCAGLVIMLGLVLLVIAILTLILASIESSTPAKSSAFVHGPLPEVPAIYSQ